MEIFSFYTVPELQQTIAEKIKKVRKSKGWTQKEMSLRADIPLSTYARIEQLGEGSLKDFFQIMVILGRADEIEKILNTSTDKESPMDLYHKLKGRK